MFGRKIAIFTENSIIENLKKLKKQTLSDSSRKAFAELPVAVMSAALIGTIIVTSAAGYNLYDSAAGKVSQLRMARALADDEAERIRSAGYDDVVKIEKPNGKLSNGYVKEIALGKEYREDIGNSVLKHKPVTINVYDSESSFFPLASVKTEKVSRWYKSGTFDKSDNGIYDETGEQHKGSIKKTGTGTGYVFLKKGAKVNGDVEIYNETNGDIYIYNSIGSSSGKTVIKHVGSSTASGYIRLNPSCVINGTVTLENTSNGGMILENKIPQGAYISKTGSGTGYLKLTSTADISNNKITINNESSGAIIINGTMYSNSILNRTGTSDSLLTLANNSSIRPNRTVNIEMNDSGSVYLEGTFYNNNIFYSSNSNKQLLLRGGSLKENSRFINNSKGNLKFYGTILNNGVLHYYGSGAGYLSFSGTVEGQGIVENNTRGYIVVASAVSLKDNKKIIKTGGGTGYLEIAAYTDLKGDFTLDSDSTGYCRFWGSTNLTTQIPQYPSIADGAYIKMVGKNYGGVQFIYNCDVLGSVNLDFTAKPSLYIFWGSTPYSAARTELKDGFTYTAT